jgi:hypothetical protein
VGECHALVQATKPASVDSYDDSLPLDVITEGAAKISYEPADNDHRRVPTTAFF